MSVILALLRDFSFKNIVNMDIGKILQSGAQTGFDALSGGFGSSIGSILSNLLGGAQRQESSQIRLMNEQLKAQKDLQKLQYEQNMSLQRMAWEQQEKLNSSQYQTAMKDLRASGLNPNIALGGSFSAPSTNPASGSSVGLGAASIPSFDNPSVMRASDLASMASSRLANAQARAQEIENQRQSSYDSWITENSEDYYVDSDGYRITNIDEWQKEHPNVVPELVVVPHFRNKGDMQAYADKLETSLKQPEAIARKLRSNLDSVVIRNIRRDANEMLKKLQKDGLAEDMAKDGEAQIQKIIDAAIAKADEKAAAKEGESGQRKITQATRYLTLGLGFVNAIGYLLLFQSDQYGVKFEESAMGVPVWLTSIVIIFTLIAGTAFIMWMGELITQHGIGNGMSLIIFTSIISRVPSAIYSSITIQNDTGMGIAVTVLILLVVIGCIPCIIFVERAQRRIPVNYAKRVQGRRMMVQGISKAMQSILILVVVGMLVAV